MTSVCEPEVDTLAAMPQGSSAILTVAYRESAPIDMAPPSQTAVAPPRRIVLTGFMGAGKSTAGRLIAEQLGWRFIDVDEEIVAKATMPVAEVFAKYGEFVFRRMETSAIAHALGEQNAVIALGGGAVEVLANRLLLEQTPKTAVVLLAAPLPTLLERCADQASGATRPVLAQAEERFRYRAPLYRRVARTVVDTQDQTPTQTAHRVLASLGLASATDNLNSGV